MKLKKFYPICLTITVCAFISYFTYKKHCFLSDFNANLKKMPIIKEAVKTEVIIVNNSLTKGTIVIVGGINNKVAAEVIDSLIRMDKKFKKIDLYLYSRGGDVFSAMGIVDVIKTLKIKVNTYAIGFCASASTYILAGGTGTRMASKYSIICLHARPITRSQYSLKTIFGISNKLDNDFWSHYATLPKNIDLTSQQKYYWVSPEEAKKWGIVDDIF
jgi:ATP-dependent Clp protease protease subunit